MKKFFTILIVLAAVMLTPSCQKELPDGIKSDNEKAPTSNPSQQRDFLSEDDNSWSSY